MKKADWVCRESNGSTTLYSGLYVSPDESMAAALSYHKEDASGGMATIRVIEYSNINEIWQ